MAEEQTKAQSIAEALGEAWDATEEETEEVAEAAPELDSEEPEQEEAVEAAEEGAEDSAATEEEAESDAPIDAPASLSEEEKAVFADLPDELQEFIRRREGERDSAFQKKTQEIAAIKSAFEPYKEMLSINGVSEAEAIQRLLNAQAYLQRDPLNALKQLAQNYGVLDKLAPQKAPEESDEYLDPQVAKLQKELEELKAQQSQSSTVAQQQEQERVLKEIANFKTATDEQGNPAHPYFDQVKHLMAPLVQQGDTLEEAYSKVIYTVPEVREAEIAKAREEADKTRRSSTKKKVVKAKKTATQVRGSTRQDAPEKPDSLRGLLESQFDELTTGG